jgi:Gram-negative porin
VVSCNLVLQRKVRSVRRNSKRLFGKPAGGYAAALLGIVLTARTASAEVTILKTDNNWEIYLAGRLGAFFSYATGDSYPVPIAPTMNLVSGGGLDESNLDRIVENDASGMADLKRQGKISKMRVRSGMLPNILSFGVRKHWDNGMTFRSQISVWGAIEPDLPLVNPRLGKGQLPRSSGPDEGIETDVREGFLEISGSFGTITGGRILTLFSRGNYENDFLYGHGYGVGFPGVRVPPQSGGVQVAGGLSRPGPTGGMAGFGSLGPAYGPAILYSTPSLGGLTITGGLFDPNQLYGTPWTGTRYPRPEGEIAYDLAAGSFKMHVFAEGAFQKLYDVSKDKDTNMSAESGGARFEVGPVRLGLGGFTGKGVGLYYAFEGSATNVSAALQPDGSPTINELRTFTGYSGLLQVALGQVDLGVGYGQTTVSQTDADKADTNDSVIKSQKGITAAVVYHATENLHLDLDFFNASFEWRGGEKQKLNFINAGTTFTF